MDKLKLGQFRKLSTSSTSKGLEFLKNQDINVHYSIPLDKQPENLIITSYQGYSYLHVAAAKYDLASVNELINRGVDFLKITAEDKQTPLHLVSSENYLKPKHIWELKGKIKDTALMEVLLSAQVMNGNAVNAESTNGLTHLHIATAVDHVDSVQLFLKSGASANHAIKADHMYLPGYTALHFAVHHSSVKASSLLLKHGADINLKDAKGVSALHLVIERLLETIDFITIGKPACCFSYDEEAFRLELIVRAVLNSMKDYYINDSGMTKLHLACLLTYSSVAEQYIKPGVGINIAVNSNSKFCAGWTPLHFAACTNVSTVQVLLQNGANILTKNAKKETPLDFCMKRYAPGIIHTLLSIIKKFKNIFFTDGVTNLLDTVLVMDDCDQFSNFLEKLKDVNTSVSSKSLLWPGYTFMHLAVAMNEKTDLGVNMYKKFYSDNEVATLPKIYNCTDEEEQIYWKRIVVCLARRCSLNVKNADGLTPIHLAFKLHRVTAVEKLLNVCKDNVIGPDNLSHFHIACAIGNESFVEKCIQKGVDVNARLKSSFEWYKQDSSYSYVKIKTPLLRVRENSTPLHVAVIFERGAIVKLLVENGANVCAQDALELTPIHLSLVYNDQVDLKILFRSESANSQDCVTKDGLSHLHVAACANEVQTIERLLENGANVDRLFETTNEELMSMFSYYNAMTPLHISMACNTNNATRALIRAGADIHAKGSTEKARSPLVYSLEDFYADYVDQNCIDHFTRKLMRDKRVIGEIENNGLTLLHFACGRFDLKWTKKLLERGADPNARIRCDGQYNRENWSGNTPLHVLIDCIEEIEKMPKNLMHMVKLLLKYGADVTKVEKNLRTPLHKIYEIVFNEDCYNDEDWSEKKTTLLSIGDALLKSQKSYAVNPVDCNRFSHFHFACVRDNVKIAEKFLDNGVDINASTDPLEYGVDSGFTPFHFAMKYKSDQVARLLIKRGAEVNLEDVDGNTPLHIGVKEKFINFELMEMLLSHGANVNARNLNGITAFQYLFMSGGFTLEHLKFFLKNGSTVDVAHSKSANFMGMIGIAMKNAEPNGRLLIFKKLMSTPDVKTALKNNFNAIQSVVAVKQDGKLTFEFYISVIKQLIEMGCNLDQKDEEGNTALHRAAYFHNHEAAKALLILGADINVINSRKESALIVETLRETNAKNARRTTTLELLLAHAWKIAFLKLEVDVANTKSNQKLVQHFVSALEKKCLSELGRAKIYKINQFLKVQDFLSSSIILKFSRMPLPERKLVDEYFACADRLRLIYPELSGILMMHYRKAVARLNSLKLGM